MTAPIPNGTAIPPEPGPERRRQLVRLDCAECGKVAAVVLPEDSSTFALCPDCAPGGAARRHATPEQRIRASRMEAEHDAAEHAAWEAWAQARYRRGASETEADAVYDAAYDAALARSRAERASVGR